MSKSRASRREFPSLAAVAVRAGVSIATVSRIVNGVTNKASTATTAKVREAVAELDYRPSSAGRVLRQGRSRLVAVLAANLANPAMAAIAASTESAVREMGLVLLLADTHERADLQDEYLSEMRAQRVRSTVLLGAVKSRGLAQAIDNGDALLFVNRRSPIGRDLGYVGIDNRVAGREVAEFFMRRQRFRLAVIHGSLESSATYQRVATFRAQIERQQGGSPALRIGTGPGLDHLEIGYRAMAELLDHGPPIDGIFCTSDLLAFGAHRCARERGLVVPDDLMVVGFDDSPLNDWVAPWLSSVRVPYDEFGKAIALAIRDAPDGVSRSECVLPHRLVDRSG